MRDNGRGIPVDTERKTRLTGVELVLTRLHAGGKFGGGSYTASGGLHGVGASVVNALAARLDIEVDREAARSGRSFRRGVAGEFAAEGPDAGFAAERGCARPARRPGRPAPGSGSGRPPGVPQGRTFSYDGAGGAGPADRLPGARPGNRGPGGGRRRRTVGGAKRSREPETGAHEVCERGRVPVRRRHQRVLRLPVTGEPVTDVLRLTGPGRFTETVPVLDDRGHMIPTEVERELEVDVALQWNNGYDTVTRSFVNVIATPKGGTHVTGFERALLKTLNEQLRRPGS